jgi:hypothetical protein
MPSSLVRVLSLLLFVGIGMLTLASPVTLPPARQLTTPLRNPPPQPKKAPLYYPTTVGATWVYDDDTTEVVTAVERHKDWYLVSVSKRNKWGEFPYGKMFVSGSGLEWFPGNDKPSGDGLLTLKLPCQPGEQWQIIRERWDCPTVTAHETERVEVPAGSFEAIRIEYTTWSVIGSRPLRREPELDQPNSWYSRDSYWYAQNVGMIKWASSRHVGHVLKSFTPGKQ